MGKCITPDGWAVTYFGEAAQPLADRLPVAMSVAVGRQMDTHAVAKVGSRRAFGGAWEAKFEEMERHLDDLPGFRAIRPHGSNYRVSLVNDVLLLPLQYASDRATPFNSNSSMKKISKKALDLLRFYGPAPTHLQPALDGLDIDLSAVPISDVLHGFEPRGVVVVYYAAHERDGLLNIGWGEVSVGGIGLPRFLHAQDLAVPEGKPVIGNAVLALAGTPGAAAARFDDAPMATPLIIPRTAAHTVGESADPTDTDQ